MGSDEEYQSLLRRRDSLQSQCDSARHKIREVKRKLERLLAAKSELTEDKAMFGRIKKQDEQVIEGKHDWKGDVYDRFKTNGEEIMTENQAYYQNSLDYALDTVNIRISELENELLSQQGLLGQCLSGLNYVWTRIENFFN